jgi:FlaG/FlaF family flagellin (archaellin)
MVKGSVTVSISADDSDGAIDYIELYLDGTLLATLPGGASTTFTFTWDTTTTANGNHVLKAIAYDDSGNSSEDSETVKVQNKGAGGNSGGKGGGPKK